MENFDNYFNPYFAGLSGSDGQISGTEGYVPTPPLPKNPVPAMAYIPFQQFTQPYSSSEGFKKGTLFPCLDKPFLGERGCGI